MTVSDPVQAALAWDGTEHLGPVWDELVRRMSASDRRVRRIHVEQLGTEARRKLAGLLGLPRLPQGPKVSVDVAKLAAALNLDDESLRALVERLRGPLDNRAAARAKEAEARSALWSEASDRLGRRIPATLERMRSAGVPDGDFGAHRRRLQHLAAALSRVPCDPPIPLPMLAWEITGDPHALDHKRKLSSMLTAAALELAGHPGRTTADALTIRQSLHALGVLPDRLSSPTITLGLRASTDSAMGRLLETAAEACVPVTVPGALLDTGAPAFRNGQWLCVENPSVVEAAIQAGSSRAIVCTSGWASADTQRLLDAAIEQGIELSYAGDYDPEGLKIAAWMSIRFGADIEMPAAAYRAANLDQALPWQGGIPDTPWDLDLAPEIHRRQRTVYQEDPSVWRKLL